MRVVRSVCGTLLGFVALVAVYVGLKHIVHPESIEHPERASLVARVVVDAVLGLACGFGAYTMFTWEDFHTEAASRSSSLDRANRITEEKG
jgi:hypothetical protein